MSKCPMSKEKHRKSSKKPGELLLNIAQDHFKMTRKSVFMEAKYKKNESCMFMILTDKNPAEFDGSVLRCYWKTKQTVLGFCDLQLCHHLFSSPEMLVES